MAVTINNALLQKLGTAVGLSGVFEEATLDAMVSRGLLPQSFGWQPTASCRFGEQYLLIHLLETPQLPNIVVEAKKLLLSDSKARVVVIATEVEEHLEDEVRVLRPEWAAATVAQQCLSTGIGLAFLEGADPIIVFPPGYELPAKCANEMETGHIPKWLYQAVAALPRLSPYLSGALKKFAKKYEASTRANSVDYDTEVNQLTALAEEIKAGDPRLFVPTGQLHVLREYERQGANRRARDHFFHTFNNLLLGYYILGQLKGPDEPISQVDDFIAPETAKDRQQMKMAEWESLWFLTCLFHDPAYIAENYHSGTFRFSFGAVDEATIPSIEISEPQREAIVGLWETQFRDARDLLVRLYSRVLKKWKASIAATVGKDEFDSALRQAYFDGRQVSHSLVSGIKLIQDCLQDKVVQRRRSPDTALTACTIAALSMMFHDQKCRGNLRKAGVAPFGFTKLPYAAVLMFVDCLQDDRRDIKEPRFPRHGVLSELRVDSQRKTVTATVCLPEVEKGVSGWPGRIAEYSDVLRWVNSTPGVVFEIDFTTLARLPH